MPTAHENLHPYGHPFCFFTQRVQMHGFVFGQWQVRQANVAREAATADWHHCTCSCKRIDVCVEAATKKSRIYLLGQLFHHLTLCPFD